MKWQLTVLEADGRIRALPNAGTFAYGAKFTDNAHVIFADEVDGRLQVHRRDVDTGALERITDVPFGLVDPSPLQDAVAFINRDGSQWSLDVAPLEGKVQVVGATEDLKTLSTTEATVAEIDVTPQMQVVEPEAPYSSLDHLFYPQLRAPGVSLISGASGPSLIVGATVTGRDRLSRHIWLIEGQLQPIPFAGETDRYFQLDAEYRNLTQAPWDLDLAGGYRHVPGRNFGSAELAVRRTVFTTDVALGARGVFVQTAADPYRRFIGPSFAVRYAAGETTQYGGAQRFLALSLETAAYPRAFGSSLDMLDIGVGVTLATPLPISKRHNLVLALRGRVLPGAPAGALTVGGISRGFGLNLGNTDTESGTLPSGYLPGNLYEPLRGYEDSAIQATGAGIANLRYRYNIIIDRGFASTFYVLPSFFFRQVTLEAFGVAATVDNAMTPLLRAAGASVELKTIFMGMFPISGYYQFAYRFDGAGGPLHIVGLSFD